MYDEIVEILLDQNIEFIYTAIKGASSLQRNLKRGFSSVHLEVATNEKIAYELAYATSMMKKRAAFLTNTNNVFEALDPIMSSAYMGQTGGMLILAVRDTDDDLSFLGPFSKIPIIVEANRSRFREAISYGIYISEKFEIPVLVELDITNQKQRIEYEKKESLPETGNVAEFVRDTSRWAATPSFRYRLHLLLNEKIKKIREEFESYPGNTCSINGTTGFLTYRESSIEYLKEDFSTLLLSTIYPLPFWLVFRFMEKMEEVFILKDPYSVIEFQIDSLKEKLRSSYEEYAFRREVPEKKETLFGYEVLRDIFGPASSMNMAHGIKKLDPKKKILALTYEDNFFHSGLPAFINALYNDSGYHLLILTKEREDEIVRFLNALNFHNYHIITQIDDIELHKDEEGLTVFILKGGI